MLKSTVHLWNFSHVKVNFRSILTLCTLKQCFLSLWEFIFSYDQRWFYVLKWVNFPIKYIWVSKTSTEMPVNECSQNFGTENPTIPAKKIHTKRQQTSKQTKSLQKATKQPKPIENSKKYSCKFICVTKLVWDSSVC